MKAPLIGAVLLSTLALAACASMDEQSAAVPAASPASLASSTSADQAYMARVEQLARRRGIEVIWLNVPTVASADQGGDD